MWVSQELFKLIPNSLWYLSRLGTMTKKFEPCFVRITKLKRWSDKLSMFEISDRWMIESAGTEAPSGFDRNNLIERESSRQKCFSASVDSNWVEWKRKSSFKMVGPPSCDRSATKGSNSRKTGTDLRLSQSAL